ncbi:hypothetical protein [Shewanella benthica]|uniref:hypothetical protein n=1 Tax=Shewanella benthica TaxID=43661 RepID=UPI0002DE2692|nr:hypothetical protein [Shewanella benthica]
MESKVKALPAIFCIDVCAYAVMNNHYHLVLKIDLDKASSLSNREIIELWCKVTKGHDVATQSGIPFHFCDYLQLIDWTGRAIRPDKKGFIDSTQPKLLNELGIAPEAWITSAKEFRRQYSGISGRWDAMCAFKKQHNCGLWCKGKASSNALHPSP